jgi:two-component system phosphate regulon sensor histidine kinase PhoR
VSARFRTFAGSFRVRLVLGYVLVVALLAGAWAWSLYGPLTTMVLDQQRTHLQTIAQAGALALTRAGVPPQETASQLVAKTDLRVTIVASDGRVLADTAESPAKMENHAARPEIAAALAGRIGTETRKSATVGTEQLYVAVPATLDGEAVALRVSESLGRIDQLASSARSTGLLLLLGALAAAIFVGVRLSRSAAEPVVRLKQVAEAMAAGQLDTPVPEADGELAGLASALATLRDEIRGRLGELEEGQATLRAVLDGLQVAVFLFEGDRIALANAAASRLFKAPAGGWQGAKAEDTGLPASLAHEIASALGRPTQLSVEVGPDPERRFYRVTVVPLEAGGGGGRTLVVVADITDVRRLDQMRRDFVANASHELKTPTAAIQLLAESATTAAQDGDVDQALVFAGQMRSEADRLRRLVLDLLDLSRLESTPEPGTITEMRAAVANALAAHRASAAAAGLTLTSDDSAVAGQDVYAAVEPTDVAVALDNLLANAIAYTERGWVAVTIAADEATVVVTVRDTGIGIPADHLPRVFERFYRVDGARSRVSGGTGLGLALVKHVTERAGGSVDIKSAPGAGTTVILNLPRAR